MSDKVVQFGPVKGSKKSGGQPPKRPDIVLPTREQLKSFIEVTDFLRTMSLSRTVSLDVDDDGLRILVHHMLEQEFVNEAESVISMSMSHGVDIDFHDGDGVGINTEDCVDDLTDGLSGVIGWIEGTKKPE